MKHEELTVFDINLIKNNAIELLTKTKITDRYIALCESIVSCVYSKGFNLSPYPNMLVSTMARDLRIKLNDTKNVISSDDIIKEVFIYLQAQNIVFIKDDSREPTWSTPSRLWYTDVVSYKKPWVY